MSSGLSIADTDVVDQITNTVNEPSPAGSVALDPAQIRLTLTPDFDEVSEDWSQLLENGFAIPYQGQAWCAAWRDTLCQEDGSTPLVVLAKSGDTPLMLLPLTSKVCRGVRVLRFLGAFIGNQNTGLWDKDFYNKVEKETVRSLLDRICEQAKADCLVLQNVPREWQGLSHPLAFDNAQQSPSPIYRGSVTSSFQELFAQTHSKSSRKNLTRKQRHLQDAGDYQIRQCQSSAEIETGLEAFLSQREARARITGIPNAFSSTQSQSFLRRATGLDSTNASDRTPPLTIWTLSVAGDIRATYLCARHNDTLYAYSNSVAHDDMLKNSPGLVLIREIIEQICADKTIDVLDLGLGEERYKTGWTSPEMLCDNWLATSIKGQIYIAAQTVKTRLKAKIRNSDKLWSLVRKIRQLRAPDS